MVGSVFKDASPELAQPATCATVNQRSEISVFTDWEIAPIVMPRKVEAPCPMPNGAR